MPGAARSTGPASEHPLRRSQSVEHARVRRRGGIGDDEPVSAASTLGPDPSHGSGQGSWTAGAVARLLGIPASTLRSWHRRYGIGPTGHHAGRHRRYTDTDIAALARMRYLITAV